MLDPTGAILRQVRKERGDKIAYLAAVLGVRCGYVSTVEVGARDVPLHWLAKLPREYLLPVAGALVLRHMRAISELEEIVSEKVRPGKRGLTGPLQGGLANLREEADAE